MAKKHYVWDPEIDAVVMETDATFDPTVVYDVEPEHYGRVVAQHVGGETQTLHFDALGSTREITDESETVVGTNLYDAWGVNRESTGTTGSDFEWAGELGYRTGAARDSYYVRSRTYVAQLAVWLSKDPLRTATRHEHVYAYVNNSPVTRIDPSGLKCVAVRKGTHPYVPRGRFLFVTFGPRVPDADWSHRIGSDMVLHWSPLDAHGGNAFIQNGCCCCEEVGLVQIVKQQIAINPANDTWTGWWNSFDWRIDGEVPYKHSTAAKPCAKTVAGGKLTDGPNFPESLEPRWFSQDFETCAVCVKGTEARTQVSGLGITYLQGAAVYGCIRWRHAIFRSKVKRSNVTDGRDEWYGISRRQIDGARGRFHGERSRNLEAVLTADVGTAPSRTLTGLLL